MGVVEDPDALQEAATMERECYTSIKNSFQEMQKVVEARSSSERSIVNEKTVFEIAYDKVRHSFFTVDTLCRSMLHDQLTLFSPSTNTPSTHVPQSFQFNY